MTEPLATYLHDHLAGSNFAIELLGSLRDRFRGAPVGNFAAALLPEIEQDRDVLRGIIDRVGQGHADLKEAAAWFVEKASRIKLATDKGQGLGTLEALETLSIGIQGKAGLWRALFAISGQEGRVRGVDYQQLGKRAESQHARVEEQRINVALAALKPASMSA
ncbi:MAG TPA: hypothetical protein VG273_19100 [Bryobacteraceae bacterium]|jgi:hypothetical protein|nr:hypothetical protein [Bryobacteraceae bacterium]